MALISAPGDTWGISGPDFLALYLGVAVLLLIVAIALRRTVSRSGPDHVVRQASGAEIAFISGGATQAMYASLAGLRAAGAVGSAAQGALTQTGPRPPDLSRLDEAVYDAAGRGVRVAHLIADHRVRSAIEELTATVARSGWLISEEARAKARLGGLLFLALTALGIVRMLAGLANGRPIGLLVVCAIGTVIAGVVFLRVPRLTRAGATAIARAHETHRHLAPSQSPSWQTYGMAGAIMGVALYGTSALWAADPAFAAEAGIRRAATDPGAGIGGGGDGGGSSCGGGGGCGGGCGGGGCGG